MNAPPVSPHPRRCNAVLLSFALVLFLLASAVSATVPSPPFDLAAPPPEAKEHPSGLHYQVLKDATSEASPDDNDYVALKFTGWTPKGQVIVTNEDKDEPDWMRMDEVYEGWRTGVGMMKVGQRLRLWIPEELGPENTGGRPRGDAVFEVQLAGFREVPDFSRDWAEPPETATKTATWARYLTLDEGEGDEIGVDEVALLAYTGWTSPAGRVFDSTAIRGRPTAFPLDRVLPPFADAVAGMKEGERRRIWIPGDIAKGQWVNSPQGDLVFEVQLLRILDVEIEDGPPSENAIPITPSGGATGG